MSDRTRTVDRQAVLNGRVDDLRELMPIWRGSRADIVCAAVFALPTDDQEHLARLIQFGRLRYLDAAGRPTSDAAYETCERILGWWNEDADIAALVKENEDLRSRLSVARCRLKKALAAASLDVNDWWRG